MHSVLQDPVVAQVSDTNTLFHDVSSVMHLESTIIYLRGFQQSLHLYTLPPAHLQAQETSSEIP